MTLYPDITFKRQKVAKRDYGYEASRYVASLRDGPELGIVARLYTGGWTANGLPGYVTRYEAAYSLYTEDPA